MTGNGRANYGEIATQFTGSGRVLLRRKVSPAAPRSRPGSQCSRRDPRPRRLPSQQFQGLAVLRMGWIAQFLFRAVVTKFLYGAAIDVVIGELPKLTGPDVSGANPVQELRSWISSVGDSSLTTVLVGAISMAVVFGLRAIAPLTAGAPPIRTAKPEKARRGRPWPRESAPSAQSNRSRQWST